jgi:hypothetical protein
MRANLVLRVSGTVLRAFGVFPRSIKIVPSSRSTLFQSSDIASLTGKHTDEGVANSMPLGTVVYSCQKEKNCRKSIQQQLQ